jgi:antitoxin (DNA-binding transcriptional repressor) of toxin-antitoxin stability system
VATIVNIHEAKTNLSRIVDEVAAGGEVVFDADLAQPSKC